MTRNHRQLFIRIIGLTAAMLIAYAIGFAHGVFREENRREIMPNVAQPKTAVPGNSPHPEVQPSGPRT